MHIDPSAGATEADAQRQAFDDRTRAKLTRHGALEGVAEGEAFKLISDL
jgi:hypothetical protein